MTSDLSDRAITILDRIDRYGKPLAVYLVEGAFRTCRLNELSRFDKPEAHLVGIYDTRCSHRQLWDDMEQTRKDAR